MIRRLAVVVAVAGLTLSCREQSAPVHPLPVALTAVTILPDSVTVGSVAGPVVVKVTDAADAPVAGVIVHFAVSLGSGILSTTVDTSGADGTASAVFTAGTSNATDEVKALADGLDPVTFTVLGVQGPAASFILTPRVVRITAPTDVGVATASVRDAFGNLARDTLTLTPRDPTLVSVQVSPNNVIHVQALRRPGETYVIASAGPAQDSLRVVVQDTGSPCTMLASSITLAVGATAGMDSGLACLHSDDPDAEYAVVAHYNTAVTNTTATISVTADGVIAPTATFPMTSAAVSAGADAAATFERDLRAREAHEIGAFVPGARNWYRARGAAVRSPVHEGDVIQMNVNAFAFCSSPLMTSARVAAITNTAIILADEENPSGGFTDDEYRAFGTMMDTLVTPLDTTQFGTQTDLDGNGRVIVLFTRAVNQLTGAGSPNGIILGFFYLRDLLPAVSPSGACPASNVAEMFYMMVPDPSAAINGNTRTKAFVQNVTASTIAHEYQHLINASRRMYINDAPRVDEEAWLNEGLSHVAEELLFYRQSGLNPRANIGGDVLAAGTPLRALFDADQLNNFKRYREYLKAPETNSPLAVNDDLATRGAAWSFLRYVADHTRPTDGDLWRRLVNSRQTGVLNLDEVLGGDTMTRQLLHDWSVSVLTDDLVPGAAAAIEQPSWDFPSAMPAVGVTFALVPRIIPDSRTVNVALRGGASSYLLFAVPPGQDALLQIDGFSGARLPADMRLTLVRIR